MILRWKARGTLLQDAKAKAVSDCVEGKCKGCGGEQCQLCREDPKVWGCPKFPGFEEWIIATIICVFYVIMPLSLYVYFYYITIYYFSITVIVL